jgi:thiol-disulfide isomerase/thioredoxin
MRSLATLFALVAVLGIRAWADDATTNADTAPPFAPSAEKSAADLLTHDLQTAEKNDDSSQATWDALDARVDNYQKQYGVSVKTTHNLIRLRQQQLNLVRHQRIDARFDAFVQKLNADPLPDVRALVARLVAFKSAPIDLQFTAVDGTPVDLAKLRGKVVLLDFWATWCPPCRAKVPEVVAAYRKYHGQGLEIVGISLDQDKRALLDFTRQNGMPWPQYFDGQLWKNAISTRFGINLIPNMWLFDRKGMLVTTFARENLDERVAKLLAAP